MVFQWITVDYNLKIYAADSLDARLLSSASVDYANVVFIAHVCVARLTVTFLMASTRCVNTAFTIKFNLTKLKSMPRGQSAGLSLETNTTDCKLLYISMSSLSY